ncbi:PH domain-containing protein [Salicibibacter cibarius]|uniref:PH domain-containing protein n=1 Tax=Salicibibacter cibarius TaxID=2743000 RepID=A0A7T7CBN5_9BACI|nr:PH domain-containing protein [Salicibibacter cibarius]QQK76068.1 PH domain-containing protein [Salicibibacter cibarius]
MNDGKRLHGATVVIMLLTRLKDFIIPIIFVFFVGATGGGIGLFAMVALPFLFIFSAVYSLLYWLTYWYRVEDQELHVKQGIFVKKHRYIQRKRVQSFDMSAGILQRMFGLVKVQIETAGGGSEPDVHLIALDRAEAERLRQTLLAKPEVTAEDGEARPAEMTEDEEPEPLEQEIEASWALGFKHLLFAGMTSGGVGLVLSAVLALFSQVDVLLPDAFYETTVGFVLSSTITFLLIAIFLIAFFAWLISIVITIVKYGQFTVVKRGNDLVISRGLLERKQLTLNVHRITAVRFVTGILRQPFGFTTIYVESKGGGRADEQQSTILVPLVNRRMANRVLGKFLPEFVVEDEVGIKPLPRRALIRYMIRAVVPILAVVVPLSFLMPSGAYTLLFILLGIFLGWLRHRNGGFNVSGNYLILQWRLFNLNRAVIPRKRIQAADVTQSPLQRWRRLSTYSVSILSSMSGKSFEIRDITAVRGEDLLAWYSKEGDTPDFSREGEKEKSLM